MQYLKMKISYMEQHNFFPSLDLGENWNVPPNALPCLLESYTPSTHNSNPIFQ